jgi:hypothetical protein
MVASSISSFKPTGIRTATAPETLGSSSVSDRLLLLLAQQQSTAGYAPAEHAAMSLRDKFNPADDYFASLGDKSCTGDVAAAVPSHAV